MGAECLRTYPLAPANGRDRREAAAADLRAAAPRAAAAGVTLLLENHEDLTATEVAEVLAAVDHESVRALFDYGNSAIFFEEPEESVRVLGRYSRSAHLKDHVALPAGAAGWAKPRWLGVPLGEGNLPIVAMTQALQAAGLARVCFENCWADDTSFQDRRGHGVFGEQTLAFRGPPDEPRVGLPPSGGAIGLAANDLAEMEAAVMRGSMRWLERALRDAGIALERPLRLPAD